MYFQLILLGMNMLPDVLTFGKHTLFGYCHDSLNFLNSVKFI